MKIVIYRCSSGYCFVPEIVQPPAVAHGNPECLVACRETTCQEMLAAGLRGTVDMIVGRCYLTLSPTDGIAVLQRLDECRLVVA